MRLLILPIHFCLAEAEWIELSIKRVASLSRENVRKSELPNGEMDFPLGKAVITRGRNLKAKYVIHTVGPLLRGGENAEAELLTDCYRNSLILAESNYLKSIAFPAISTWIFGYQIEHASLVALDALKDFLNEAQTDKLKEILFVLYTLRDLGIYEKTANIVFKD
jgi:O-acetyl-ADP-ribose deacetylase